MEIRLFYNENDAIRLFESLGFETADVLVEGKETDHGFKMPNESYMAVVNPISGDEIRLRDAMQRLMQYKLLTDLYWTDKMQVMNALSCAAVNPMSDIEEAMISE